MNRKYPLNIAINHDNMAAIMQLSDFDYNLPEELIAKFPLQKRSASRLLMLNKANGEIKHQQFSEINNFLNPGDVLVVNNTKVMPARLQARKITGAKIEILIERITGINEALALLRSNKPLKIGTELVITENITATIIARQQQFFHLRFNNCDNLQQLLQQHGSMPLPHYMQREAQQMDSERYQTVFSQHLGAVAAPTAGLHFDEQLMQQLTAQKIDVIEVTLHVGSGTFQPVRVDKIKEHKMHSELAQIDAASCDKIITAKANGGKVVAVGTTAMRTLETAALSGSLQPFNGETDIFIYPGFNFKVVDALITNFHLPQSTLLMLVSAFAGMENIKNAYQQAIEQRYRFFSYGDAMLII